MGSVPQLCTMGHIVMYQSVNELRYLFYRAMLVNVSLALPAYFINVLQLMDIPYMCLPF